ncbi:hypothetical protein N7527_004587, partial [Penicillium freii]
LIKIVDNLTNPKDPNNNNTVEYILISSTNKVVDYTYFTGTNIVNKYFTSVDTSISLITYYAVNNPSSDDLRKYVYNTLDITETFVVENNCSTNILDILYKTIKESRKNTPITIRSEVTLILKVILIESLPDPII